MAEQHVVRVEGEDLALRVALLDLDGDDPFLDLTLEAHVADAEADGFGKKIARELLRQRARARRASLRAAGDPITHRVEDVAHQRDAEARNAQSEMAIETAVLGGDDRLAQLRRDIVVAD